MKTLFTLLIALIFSLTIYSQNYKEVRIYLNDVTDIQTLLNSGMEFDHLVYEKDNSIRTFISADDFTILQSTGFSYEILIDDWYSHYKNLPKLTEFEKQQFIQQSKDNFNVDGFGFGSMGGFYTLAEINTELDSMYLQYPNIVTQKFSVGLSIENRPIYAIKISDNPTINESEPQVHMNALIHAREPQAMMTIMYYIYYLLENYGTDPEVTYLVNNREIYFIPCINPDGYEYNRSTNPSGGGMWRKNRRNNGGSYGVDLNRNFGYMWGYDNIGSSGTPSSETYRGTAAFSEPETQSIRNFTNSKNFKTALNYHTYGNYLLYPWGYISSPTPDNAIFDEFSTDMVAYNGYANGQPPAILYEVNGSSDDWMYGEQSTKPKIFGMTPEVGSTGFWPTQAEIFPLAIENLIPNLYYTWVAGAFVKMINPSFSQQYFNPGDFVEISIPQLRNKGLSDANNVALSLSSDNPQITINNGNISIGNILARTTVNNSQKLSFTLGSGLAADVKVKMIVTVSTNGTPMFADTLSLIVGSPTYIFADTTNNPFTLWTITGTPISAPKWAITTTTYNSPPNSYTDSPAGNYIANSTITMTLTNPINLTGFPNPRLTFYTKYDIENNWDYGQVEISTNNGATWIPLQGQYTNPGTGSFQPNGEPLYDGSNTNWIREEISLASYISSQVKIRFELKTDGAVQTDGWYVDDIKIFYYSVNFVELTTLTALIEGFYNGSTSVTDTITVQLRNTNSPYALVDQSKIVLNSSGQGSGRFYNAVNGTPYYIVLKHRNAVETWSALPQTFTSNALTYDFTTGQDKAYGNNLKLIGTKWCIYGGDVNQDGAVVTTDVNSVFAGNVNGVTGYVTTDLNGDMFTEIQDLNIVFINNVLGVMRKAPPGYLSSYGESK